MNFDYGNILTNTFQITWKHKVLWALRALPILLSFATLPFMFSYIFILDGNLSEVVTTVLGITSALFICIFFIASIVLTVVTSTSIPLAVIRIERGEGSLKFLDLLKDGLKYFWRQLGVLLIIQLSIGLVFTLFFACMFVSTMVTMGMASLCFQPLSFLIMPAIFLTMGVQEAAHTAVIHENLGAADAVKRGLFIVREHIWKYVIITLIIFMGLSIVSSFITFPIFLPVFFIPFLIETNTQIDPQIISVIGVLFLCIFFPFMAFFSVISQIIMKTSLTLTYLRLAHPLEEQVISLPETG